jgi:hypothetical protein
LTAAVTVAVRDLYEDRGGLASVGESLLHLDWMPITPSTRRYDPSGRLPVDIT